MNILIESWWIRVLLGKVKSSIKWRITTRELLANAKLWTLFWEDVNDFFYIFFFFISLSESAPDFFSQKAYIRVFQSP